MRACVIIPAYEAERTLAAVIESLREELPALPIFVVDDGSTDATAKVARDHDVELLQHEQNRGKGAALVTGLTAARRQGYDVALTVDADGQHPADAAKTVLEADPRPEALVLGIRGLAEAGAPRKNQISNRISNFFISFFAGKKLQDTQCGLRRYPIGQTLTLAARGRGYDFEAEILLRAVWARVPIVEKQARVLYPADRVTHFHVVRDPWRIVRTVVAALVLKRHKKKLIALAILILAPLFAHVVIGLLTALTPPVIHPPALTLREQDGVRRAGKGWSVVHGVRVAQLAGTADEIGTEHSVLLRDRMLENEGVVWNGFADLVPFAPARALMFDAGRFQYRHVDEGFPEARRREVAAEAAAFTPDPYATHQPTYPRMVFLHALYDIALSFEHSPLLGCTAFGLGPDRTADGHALFARAFDFEAADVFDRDKAVFVVREDGKIPFASVAWPGFVGVVTGMNAEGVAVAVNGGRAREPSTTGIPVAFSLRETLEQAHDANEAVAILSAQQVMVSHLVYVGDAKGHFVVVERAPGVPAFVRDANAVTNHFEGPLRDDPKDARVRASTTTLPRRARVDELVQASHEATVTSAVAMLRDHSCATGQTCLIGDRKTIDALIATHGVVFDLTARAAWVSEGPHLSGAFVKIDLAKIVSTGEPPSPELETVAPDAILDDPRYEEGRARAGGPLMGPGRHRPNYVGPE